MNKLTHTPVIFLVCLTAQLAFAQPSAPPPDLASADWSVKQAKVLNAEPTDAVWKFINGCSGNTNLTPGNGELCEFHFADLRHSGELSLVASFDGGGTADCNELEVFDKSPTGIESYDFDATQDYTFGGIEDIDRNGRQELIVNAAFAGGGDAGHCIATWPVVYAWNGIGYADASAEFRGFYQRRLAKLEREISPQTPTTSAQELPEPWKIQGDEAGYYYVRSGSSPQVAPAPAPQSADSDCLKAEAAKIERFLGTSSDAGMTDAIRWANSDNPHDRTFAAYVLGNIGGAEAVGYLRTLSNDPNRNVAMSGKDFLTHGVKEDAVNPTILGQRIPEDGGYPQAK